MPINLVTLRKELFLMEADNPIVSDFRAQVQKIIQANLKDNLSSMSDEEDPRLRPRP